MLITRPFIALVILVFVSLRTHAQTGTVTGRVLDASDKKPVEFAAVTLKNTADSSRVFGAVTNTDGSFKVTAVPLGSYTVRISFMGYAAPQKSVTLDAGGTAVDFGAIEIEHSGISLNEVMLTAQKAAVTLKKDTLEFNAGAFKTRPDATTEELLKKLPGVEIDKDGNITVGGQRVARLTVDGKDFFGTDPKTATKNLPADAIDKIQVVDSKTLEAKATGIDDGQREKVLNLTIKKDKKHGWFGNANASAGNADRYNGYLSVNSFNNNRQLAILGMSNNVNAANFSYDDLSAFSGGNLGDVFAPPGGGNFSVNSDGKGNTTISGSGLFDNAARGIVNTQAGGVNFSDEFGKNKNLKLSSSYFVYFSAGDQNRLGNTSDLGVTGNGTTKDILNTYESNFTHSYSQAHRANARVEYHPDSLTDITFRPNVIYNISRMNSARLFRSDYEQQGKVNAGTQDFGQSTTAPQLFGEFTALRRLGYKKGSVSLRVNGTWMKSDGDWDNLSDLVNYTTTTPSAERIDQEASQDLRTRGYTANGNYARPFGDKWSTNIAYSYTQSNSLADQLTLDYDPVTDRYAVVVPDLTNTFNYTNWNQAARLGFIYTPAKTLVYNFGLSLQQSGLNGETIFNNGGDQSLLRKDFWNVLPRLSVNYNPANNKSLQFNYAESVIMPAANLLQPVQNNSNPLYKREGNPDLQPRRNHRASLNFNTFRPGTDHYWNGYFLFNYAFDAIAYNTRNENGIQYQSPLNVDGNYQLYTGSYFGMPSGLKGLRLNFGLNFTFEHYKNFVNAEFNATDRFGINPNGSINYDQGDKLNLGLSYSVVYNKLNNKLAAAADNKSFNFNNNFTMSYEFVKNLRVEADLSHTGFAGRADGFNRNYFLLNAGLMRYFMNHRMNVAFKGFDILKQNTNIVRNVFNTRVEDIQYNGLTRYYYLSMSYRLAKAGAGNERRNPRNTMN